MDAHAAAPTSPALATLNVFQRLARQWDHLHPYNAAQVIKIKGTADIAALHEHWYDALAALGLGRANVVGKRFGFVSLNGERCHETIVQVPAGSLEQFITDQLNHTFGPEEVQFRPFVVQEADHHYLGVIYHHWVADSVSIRILLRDWFARMHDPASARNRKVRMPRGGYWRYFGPGKAGWELGEGIVSSVRWSSRFRRARRLEGPGINDFTVRFSLHDAPDGLIERLAPAAKSAGITLNDLFLAAIAEACYRFVPTQRTLRRQDLALGTIVDLRPHVHTDMSDTFGLFLGFTSVICRPDDLGDFTRLLTTISRQSALHKQTGVPQASVIRMLAGLFAGTYYSRSKVINFYRKRVPLAGGISNVNMTRTWVAPYYNDGLILDYIRVSPTGPMMPLVFTPTTLGKHLNVGLTYRTAIVSPERAEAMAQMFIQRLECFVA